MVFKSKRNLKLSSENLELWLEEFLLSLLISMAAAYKFLRIEISREGEKKNPRNTMTHEMASMLALLETNNYCVNTLMMATQLGGLLKQKQEK